MLFNADGKIKKYDHTSIASEDHCISAMIGSGFVGPLTKDSALDILREFADVRLSIYETPIPQIGYT